jgi:hypothetical protein
LSGTDPGRRQGAPGRGESPANADNPPDTSLFSPACLGQRIQAAALGAIGSLPRALRDRAAHLWNAANLKRLTEAMSHWIHAAELEEEHFANLFFGRKAADPSVKLLHKAALDVSNATDHSQLGAGAEKLAAALQVIGLDRWPGFLADVRDRTLDPATLAAMEHRLGHPFASPHPGEVEVAPGDATPGSVTSETNADSGESVARLTDPDISATGQPEELPLPGQAGGGIHPPAWGPPPNVIPPVRNPGRVMPGAPSRPTASPAGGHSLWDEDGGEWQYHPADELQNSYWDYNEHADANSPWRNVPIDSPPAR